MTKAEIQSDTCSNPGVASLFGRRNSGFVIRTSFVIRLSAFVIYLAPHLRPPELLEQQLLECGVGAGQEKGDAARGAILAQTLAEILHGLLVSREAIFAKSDFLLRAGLRIHQAQVPVSGRGQLFR